MKGHRALLMLVLVASACGGGGGSPTAPTTPTAPLPPPSARLVTVEREGPDVTFPDWPCPSGACRYEFEIQNLGPDCASAVRGTIKLIDAAGTTVAEDDWALDPARVVRPQEVVRVEEGSLPFSVLNALDRAGATVTFAFDAVRCS